MHYLYLCLAAVCFTSGGALMKPAEGLTKLGPSLGFLACFAAGAALQALAMRGNAMGITHILVLGLEAVLALGMGAFFFQEALSAPKLIGVGLIVGGMVVLKIC